MMWLIPHILWVHRQGLTRPGHDKYTRIMYKSTNPSSGWCILLGELAHSMYVLLPISHVLWMHGQGLTSPGHIQYTDPIHTSPRAPKMWDQIWRELQKHQSILRLVNIVRWRSHPLDVLPPISHVSCVLRKVDKTEEQPTHSCHVHSSLRAHKVWNQMIWWEL